MCFRGLLSDAPSRALIARGGSIVSTSFTNRRFYQVDWDAQCAQESSLVENIPQICMDRIGADCQLQCYHNKVLMIIFAETMASRDRSLLALNGDFIDKFLLMLEIFLEILART